MQNINQTDMAEAGTNAFIEAEHTTPETTENMAERAKTEIRRLPSGGWQAYKAFRLEALASEPQAFGSSYEETAQKPDSVWEQRLECAASGDGNWLLFAEERNALVGMIGAFTKEDPHVAYIVSVYVAEPARGRGIAKKLMTAILEELAVSGTVKKVVLTVNKNQAAALSLYQGFGFDVVGEEETLMGDGNRHSEFVMEKPVLQ